MNQTEANARHAGTRWGSAARCQWHQWGGSSSRPPAGQARGWSRRGLDQLSPQITTEASQVQRSSKRSWGRKNAEQGRAQSPAQSPQQVPCITGRLKEGGSPCMSNYLYSSLPINVVVAARDGRMRSKEGGGSFGLCLSMSNYSSSLPLRDQCRRSRARCFPAAAAAERRP